MDVTCGQVRAFRLRAHHLDHKLPPGQLEQAAGACGIQNSPPGAWETAAWNRVEGCTRAELGRALYEEKTLLQAWSIRGVPLVFPTGESGVFLAALSARVGEEPWIYTRGIGLALEFLGLDFNDLLPLALAAADTLRERTVRSKEELDRVNGMLREEYLEQPGLKRNRLYDILPEEVIRQMKEAAAEDKQD